MTMTMRRTWPVPWQHNDNDTVSMQPRQRGDKDASVATMATTMQWWRRWWQDACGQCHGYTMLMRTMRRQWPQHNDDEVMLASAKATQWWRWHGHHNTTMTAMRCTWPAPTMRTPSTSSIYTVVVNILVQQTTGHDQLSVGLELFVQSAQTGNWGTKEPLGPATTVWFKLVVVQFSYQFFYQFSNWTFKH